VTAQQIADAIIEEVQPTAPTKVDIIYDTVGRHTFTAKTAKLSLEEAIYRRCGDNAQLCNEVYEIIKTNFENQTK
jgi:hypothetical protein